MGHRDLLVTAPYRDLEMPLMIANAERVHAKRLPPGFVQVGLEEVSRPVP
jgi:hypothetical protein